MTTHKGDPREQDAFDHSQSVEGVYVEDMAHALPLVSDAPYPTACPDCPAARQEVFANLVGTTRGACVFQCLSIEARAPIPDRWFGQYTLGLIRRGVLIRQRVDAHGRATAIDAAGPGCLVPFGESSGGMAVGGYAATRVLVCLCPTDVVGRAVTSGDQTAPDLVRMQQEALERVERIADARGRSTVDSRVAALLIAMSETLGPPKKKSRIPSGLQQRDMAALLGVRHESVCRSMRKLEAQNIIGRGPEGVKILDRPALEAI